MKKYFVPLFLFFSFVAKAEPSQAGYFRFTVPIDTFLYINGTKTVPTGTLREFITPPIKAGEVYSAKVFFDFRNKQGRRFKRTKIFKIKPGETITFSDLEGITEQMEAGR